MFEYKRAAEISESTISTVGVRPEYTEIVERVGIPEISSSEKSLI